MTTSGGRVLCVDDEPNVLEGLKRTLRRSYAISTALGPEEGLKVLAEEGPFAAIVSDLRMPGMDGIAFFEECRRISPATMRILLTGNADVHSAVAAVNRGAIFRFLLKPCAPDVLQQVIADAVDQHNLHSQQRALLGRTAPEGGATDAPEAASFQEALMKFLVVDSSATKRRIMINTLERMGYTEVVEAKDGEEALDRFGSTIRCVITEWDMPRMSGIELIRSLRAHPYGRKVPILMLSTRSHRDDILVAKHAGVDEYIVRPFVLSVLKEKLEGVLRASR